MDCVNNVIRVEAFDGAEVLILIAEIGGVKEYLNAELNDENPDNDLVAIMAEDFDTARALYK